MYRLLPVFILLFFGCDSPKESKVEVKNQLPVHKKGSLSLFVHIGFEHQFTVTVNDSLTFTTTYPGATDEGPQILIDIIPKTSPLMKFKVHIADRDTTFRYNMENVDSLRFGLFANNSFMISNQDQNVWFYD